MLVKIILIFLAAMAGLGMIFKVRVGNAARRLVKAQTCPKCGRHRIGKGPCPCGANKG